MDPHPILGANASGGLPTQLMLSAGGRSKFWNKLAPNRFENGLDAFSEPPGPLEVPYCGGRPVEGAPIGSLSRFAIDAGYR